MKNIMIPTKDLTREEWLELRRNGIGGSDASVVMGKNPWRSIQQLWEDKTGKTQVQENSNEYTYWGNVMEGIIRKEFMNRTGPAETFYDVPSPVSVYVRGCGRDCHRRTW